MNNVVTRISTPYSTGPLPCPYGCGRSFKHATQKAIHVRKAHTGERPFVWLALRGAEEARAAQAARRAARLQHTLSLIHI